MTNDETRAKRIKEVRTHLSNEGFANGVEIAGALIAFFADEIGEELAGDNEKSPRRMRVRQRIDAARPQK